MKKLFFPACILALALSGCFTARDASFAPGGTKSIVAFPVQKFGKAPVTVANHLFFDRNTRTKFDIQITSIDGKSFEDDGRRTKYYYTLDAGPHVIAVSCDYRKLKWNAEFDFLIGPGEEVEITGDILVDGVALWFADIKTGKPVTAKVTIVDQTKKPTTAP